MNLYKVTLKYGYEHQKSFIFFVVAKNELIAGELASKTFEGYSYGDHHIGITELLASEGQYAKPDILLISEGI